MSRRTSRPKTLSQSLDGDKLKHWQQKVTLINRLNQHLQTLLGDTIAKNCRLGNLDRHQLYIECANSNVSMRVQYNKMQILSDFQQHFLPELKTINIRINPELVKVKREPVKTEGKAVPESAAGYIQDVAKNAPQGLQKKLEKLAKLAAARAAASAKNNRED